NIRAGLFVTRQPTTIATAELTLASSATALAFVPTPTAEPMAAPTATPFPATTLPATALPDILSLPDPEKLVTEQPNDPISHFALAAALLRDGKALRSQQELNE